MKVITTIRMDNDLLCKVKERAKKEKRTTTNMIEVLIEKALKDKAG